MCIYSHALGALSHEPGVRDSLASVRTWQNCVLHLRLNLNKTDKWSGPLTTFKSSQQLPSGIEGNLYSGGNQNSSPVSSVQGAELKWEQEWMLPGSLLIWVKNKTSTSCGVRHLSGAREGNISIF